MQSGGDDDPDVAGGDPPSIRPSIIGRKKRRFGTGRVMSQIKRQALRWLRARARKGAEPMDFPTPAESRPPDRP